jgi:MFS superfamily sulfate permease-like transporter
MDFFTRVRAVIRKLTVILDVLPGVLVGAVLAFVTALLLISAQVNAMQTTVNG